MRICKVKNCEKKHKANGYCERHYSQIRDFGKILERTIFDPNEIIDRGDYCEIILHSIKHQEVSRTKIDKDDLERVEQYKWRLCSNGDYVQNRKVKLLHQFILGEKKGFDIDHINHDKFDNRKKNLRHCTRQQNLRNRKKQGGIYWDKNKKKWRAQIGLNYKNINLGYFKDKQEALKIRKQAELKYFKDFAPKRN